MILEAFALCPSEEAKRPKNLETLRQCLRNFMPGMLSQGGMSRKAARSLCTLGVGFVKNLPIVASCSSLFAVITITGFLLIPDYRNLIRVSFPKIAGSGLCYIAPRPSLSNRSARSVLQ